MNNGQDQLQETKARCKRKNAQNNNTADKAVLIDIDR